MKSILILAATGMAAVQLSAATVDWSKLPPAADVTGVTFDKDIAPIFKATCVRCHGAERPRGGLRLDTLEGALKGTKRGAVVTAGDSASSLLVKSISQLDPQIAMPPKPRGPRPMGTNAPAMHPPDGGPAGGPPPGGPGGDVAGSGGPPPGGPGGDNAGPGGPPPGGPGPGGQPPRNFGPMPKPLTAEQVGLVRAWIDQGAK